MLLTGVLGLKRCRIKLRNIGSVKEGLIPIFLKHSKIRDNFSIGLLRILFHGIRVEACANHCIQLFATNTNTGV